MSNTKRDTDFWNYRVLQKGKSNTRDKRYYIIECYYFNDGKPFLYCDASLFGETKKELKQDIDWMYKSFKLPVLKEKDFK